jgi:ABC-type branched-subunit amino acid transport system substrate-binding protein
LRSRKLLAVAGAITALSLGVAACGDDDDNGDGGGGEGGAVDLTIGALIPQTGDLSAFGPAGQKAAELAAEDVNNALQEAGSDATIDLQIADTETSDRAGTQAARQLISGGASCLAGAWASSVTIPVGQTVAARQLVPLISPASTSPEITDLDDDGFVFRVAPSDALQGQVLADAVGEEFGTDATISAAARNDAYGEGIINQFAESFEENGGTVNGPVLYDPEAASYNSEAGQIVEGDPDGYVIIDFEDPYGKVGAALARTGSFDAENLFTADGLAFSDGIPGSIPGDAINGANGTRPATPEEGAAAEAFDEAYSASDQPPKQRNTFDAQNYDAVMLCALASIAAGSADGSDIRDQIQNVASPDGTEYDSTDLVGAIEALENGEEIDFQGASGTLDLDDNGDPTVGFYDVWSYDNSGEFSIEDTVELEAGE